MKKRPLVDLIVFIWLLFPIIFNTQARIFRSSRSIQTKIIYSASVNTPRNEPLHVFSIVVYISNLSLGISIKFNYLILSTDITPSYVHLPKCNTIISNLNQLATFLKGCFLLLIEVTGI